MSILSVEGVQNHSIIDAEEDLESFLSESVVMKDFSHPNVLGLLGVVFDTPDGTPYLVLPFMENGNLKHYLKSKREKVHDVNTLPQVSITLYVCRQDGPYLMLGECMHCGVSQSYGNDRSNTHPGISLWCFLEA